MVYIPDDFEHKCVYPNEFFEDLRNIFKNLKSIIESKNHICKIADCLPLKMCKLIVPINIDKNKLSIAWTISTISQLLFQHFEIDSFEIIPIVKQLVSNI